MLPNSMFATSIHNNVLSFVSNPNHSPVQYKNNSKKYMLSKGIVSFTNQLILPPPVPKPIEISWKDLLPKLQTRPLPERVESSTYETVLIAFSPLPYLEFLLRNMILQFPSWAHTVVCGNINTDMITDWNLPVQIISLNIDTITVENYNELLLMESFWMLFQGETLLVYNDDSKPLENIDEWITQIQTQTYIDLKNNTTIRNKKALLDCLQSDSKE